MLFSSHVDLINVVLCCQNVLALRYLFENSDDERVRKKTEGALWILEEKSAAATTTATHNEGLMLLSTCKYFIYIITLMLLKGRVSAIQAES